MSIVCSKCGTANIDQASFCKNCGSKLESKTNKYTKDTKKDTDSGIVWVIVAGFCIAILLISYFSERNQEFDENINFTEVNATEVNATEANVTEANVTEANATEANATEAYTTAYAPAVDGAAAYAACGACHGADGKTAALGKSAIIAGQSAADIESKLKEYKAGTRDVTGNGALMKGQVANLSDDQIKALADYISELDSVASMQSQVYIQNTFFSHNNIKSFLESHLQSKCFKSIYDVSYYFSKSIYRYYNFTSPTLEMLLDDNKKYCYKWDEFDYKLNSFNILNQGYKDGKEYAEVVESVSYMASNSKKIIIGTIDLFLTLVNENGQIKIVSIYSKNNKKTTYNNAQNDIDPDDYLKPYAYELMTGKKFVSNSDIVVKYNSKDIKIYCLSDMSLCKTEQEVLEYRDDSLREGR